MAQARFYLLHLKPRKGILLSSQQLLGQLNKSIDWFHLAPNSWILFSTSSPEKWELRLRKLVRPDGNMFISVLDMSTENRNGWMGKNFWKWVRKNQVRSKRKAT